MPDTKQIYLYNYKLYLKVIPGSVRWNCKFEMKNNIILELLYRITSSYLSTATEEFAEFKQECEKRVLSVHNI